MSTRILVCCGSGGVGKTTTSAALAVASARAGHRVAVLTIDPARRLADSLGLETLDNVPRRVALDASGTLDALMLDMKATWDGVIERFSPSEAAAQRILDNRYYQFASTRLAGSHEYMALQRLYELETSGDYDVILLDTPPTRHALEFLTAPDRLAGLFDEGVMTWISMPKNSRGFKALEKGSELVSSILKRLVGTGTISEIATFFDGMQDLWDGFQERSAAVNRILRSDRTTFLLVTTPAPAARAEAHAFVEVLREGGMPFGGFVVNRVLQMPQQAEIEVPFPAAPSGVAAARWAEVCEGVRRVPLRQKELAQGERAWVEQLRGGKEEIWLVPELGRDVHDLEGLTALGAHLQAVVQSTPTS